MDFEVSNTHGIHVTLCTRGAAIRRIETPDRFGRFSNIALSPCARDQNWPRYACAGATLGPSAGRVPEGLLTLSGKPIALQPNEGPHHLHGGALGLSGQDWVCEGASDTAVRFCCSLPDGWEGYPGNRRFTVTYTLDAHNALTIRLHAESDAPTWVNLSNHVYWNLSGDFSTSVASHRLLLPADTFYWNDAEHIPQAARPVAGTPFDFRRGALLGPRLQTENSQLAIAHGYNNAYCLAPEGAPIRLSHPASGRVLQMTTDLPAVTMYTGGYLDAGLLLEGGLTASRACALALEPQFCPLTRTAREAPFITAPGQPYDHWIACQWSVNS